MSYLPSLALLIFGLLALAVQLVRLGMALRRFGRTTSMVRTAVRERTGLLKARWAGVRVAVKQRSRKSTTTDPAYS